MRSPWYAALMVAGLAPFAGLTLWLCLDQNAPGLQLLNLYSFGITSFLLGTWWQPLAGNGRAFGAIVGNGLFLVTAFSLAWLPTFFPTVSALLLLLILALEQYTPWVGLRDHHYRRLRLIVTLSASACLLLAQWRLWG